MTLLSQPINNKCAYTISDPRPPDGLTDCQLRLCKTRKTKKYNPTLKTLKMNV